MLMKLKQRKATPLVSGHLNSVTVGQQGKAHVIMEEGNEGIHYKK